MNETRRDLQAQPLRILVVCMGNICRSPTGEAVLRTKAAQLGVAVEVDSAGTIGYHAGNPPDQRAREAAERRGYSFAAIRSRQVCQQDFAYFDRILAADKENMRDLLNQSPAEHADKISLFLKESASEYEEIPDPYYGGDRGFELVLDLIEEASDQLLNRLK